MKQTLIGSFAAVVLLGASVSADAVDINTFNCEKATVVELTKVSRARGQCIRKCLTKKNAPNATALLKSCSPPFDIGTGSTQECADKTVDKYADMITLKCSGFMPACGGYQKGWCSNDTLTMCDRDITDCPGVCSLGLCVHDGVTPCTANGDCAGGCGGRCSTTTSTACGDDGDCPGVETCTTAGIPKDIPDFIQGNLYDGAPGPLVQVDTFGEVLFGCRQKICEDTGDVCGTVGDCPGVGPCSAGKCSTGTSCDYDGQCGVGTTKKCIALGRCSVSLQSCRMGGTDCPGAETCERYGRCVGGASDTLPCFDSAVDCGGMPCTRTVVQTDRKKELLCTNAVSDTLGKFTFDVSNCQALCAHERDFKDGQRCTDDPNVKCDEAADCGTDCRPTSCDPFAVGRCSNDLDQVCTVNTDCQSPGVCNDLGPDPISGKLKACRDLAISKALATINTKCPSLPVCGAYSYLGSPIGNFNVPPDLITFVLAAADGQYKEDNPDLSPGANFCLP